MKRAKGCGLLLWRLYHYQRESYNAKVGWAPTESKVSILCSCLKLPHSPLCGICYLYSRKVTGEALGSKTAIMKIEKG